MQRQLEEELANMQYEPDMDDRLEKESNYSIFNQSQAHFNQIDQSQNIDEYLEEVLQKQRLQNQKLLANDDAWQEFLGKQSEQINDVIPDDWNDQLEDLKQLNEVKIEVSKQTQEQNKLKEDEEVKERERMQGETQTKFEIPQIKYAEDELINQYKAMEEQQQQLIQEELEKQQIILEKKIQKASPFKKQANKDQQQQMNNTQAMMSEYELEIERLYMQREDHLSRTFEEQTHYLRFIQKDREPPILPPYLRYSDNPIKNQPVQRTPNPNAPMNDNYIKYKVALNLPKVIDLSNIKILYSKAKEEADLEQRRIEEFQRKKEAEHQRLTDLVEFSQQITSDIFESQRTQNQGILSRVNKLLNTRSNIKAEEVNTKEKVLDIKVLVSKNQQEEYGKKESIYDKYFRINYEQNRKQIVGALHNLNKLNPNILEFEKPKNVKISQKEKNCNLSNGDFMINLSQIEQNQNIIQALEIHASEQRQTKIEIKNEEWGKLDMGLYSHYSQLTTLNLSMNKIFQITGTINCPLLTHLSLSDNLLKEITPQLFQKCDNLKYLNLDINQIKKVQYCQQLINLEELSLSNNQIQIIEGLSTLIKLRRLNLSFNRINKIENLQSLVVLEQLDLGKNQITNIDHLVNNTNKFFYLNELSLYSNQIQTFPKNFSLPQLRILNVNRNQDMNVINLLMCPMIEVITCSYCAIKKMASFSSCVCLKELDISFNQINSFDEFLEGIKHNSQLRLIRFNDNPFLFYKDKNLQNFLLKKYFFLQSINGETVVKSHSSNFTLPIPYSRDLNFQFTQASLLRSYINKIVSQKIRVSYFSITHLMKYTKAMLPYYTLQAICSANYSSEHQIFKNSAPIYDNHIFVNKQKQAIKTILKYWSKRKIRFIALTKRMIKHENKIIKLQALIKGHFTRIQNQQKIQKIKRDAPKRTRKYKLASKLQALIKGFLFRQRRKKALKNLQQKKVSNIDEFEEDLDVDNFFNVKEENLYNGLILPNEDLMQKMIQMMAVSRAPVFQQQQSSDYGQMLPQIKNPQQRTMVQMILPKSLVQTNQMLNSNNNYYQGKQNRPPSARSSAITEIDTNTSNNQQYHQQQARKNNLMSTGQGFDSSFHNRKRLPSLNGGQSQMDEIDRQTEYSMNSNPFYPRVTQKLMEEKKQKQQQKEEVMKEWGFKNEETMKIFEARFKKKQSMKAKKQMTAAEKYAMIKMINEKNHH